MESERKRRVGIVGFGHLGQFLAKEILESTDLELAFVWNRTPQNILNIPENLILVNLNDFQSRNADLIVEVAHPHITCEYGEEFLKHADYMVGSPTALADKKTEERLRNVKTNFGLYVPAGAFWGGEDIRRMADRGTLKGLTVTMTKHPSSLKLLGKLEEINAQVSSVPTTLFDGSVRELCPLAPNNVNTMAAAAIAAHNLGFDSVKGRLISDPSLTDYHIVEVEVQGPSDQHGNQFTVHTVRKNPAKVGAVTGQQTYISFLASMRDSKGKGSGIHLV